MKRMLFVAVLALSLVLGTAATALAHPSYSFKGHVESVKTYGSPGVKLTNGHGTVKYARARVYYHVTSTYRSGWRKANYHAYYYVLPGSSCHWSMDGYTGSYGDWAWKYKAYGNRLAPLYQGSYQSWNYKVLNTALYHWYGAE